MERINKVYGVSGLDIMIMFTEKLYQNGAVVISSYGVTSKTRGTYIPWAGEMTRECLVLKCYLVPCECIVNAL